MRPRGGFSDSITAGKLFGNAPLIKMEAVTSNERHKKRGRKDGDKITGDGNRLFGFDHIVLSCAAWLECDGKPYRDLSSIGAWTCSERTAFTDTRLRRFNIRRRTGTNRAGNIWRGY